MMPREDPAQLVPCPYCGGETETARRSRKISVPVGYKFNPTDGDLVNHHLQPKLMNIPEDYCLIPEHNHYEAEPWDLIAKYNELSDDESKDNTCFFFSNNRNRKRNGRSTPKGHWHETSTRKLIEGSHGHGVTYVMKYFTFKIGRQQKDEEITPWRMREYTDPSNKVLALCKIFKDVVYQKKKNNVPDSVIPEPSNIMISPGLQTTPEASPNTVMESLQEANLTNDTLVSPQLHLKQFDESQVPTLLSDLNLMKDGAVSPQEQPMHIEEGSPLAQNASDDQLLLDFNNPRQYDQLPYSKNTPNNRYSKEHDNMLYLGKVTSEIGFVSASKRSWAEGTSLEASQQPPMKKPQTRITRSPNLDLQPRNCGYYPQQTQFDLESIFSSMNSPFSSSMSFPHKDNRPIGFGSEEVNSEEASLANPPIEPMNFASSNSMVSSQHQLQVPMEKLLADLQAASSPSNYICLDDIPSPPLPPRMEVSPTNSTNTEGHSDESTVSLSPSDRTYDKVNTSKPSGVEIHEAPQTIQQALPQLSSPPQSPTQLWNFESPYSSITPQYQFLSKEMIFPGIEGLWD